VAGWAARARERRERREAGPGGGAGRSEARLHRAGCRRHGADDHLRPPGPDPGAGGTGLSGAGKVIDAVKAGALKHLFLIGGCDGARTDRNHYTEFGEALDALGTVEPDLAKLVDLKFFCGFTSSEIAAMRGCSERTVERHWAKARLYLHRSLGR